MTTNIEPMIGAIKDPGAIFATAIEEEIILSNFKYADIVLTSAEAETPADMTLTICGKKTVTDESGNETEVVVPIPFQERIMGEELSTISIPATGAIFSVGGDTNRVFRVTADDLANGEYQCAVIKTTAIASCEIIGALFGVAYEPRYSGKGFE